MSGEPDRPSVRDLLERTTLSLERIARAPGLLRSTDSLERMADALEQIAGSLTVLAAATEYPPMVPVEVRVDPWADLRTPEEGSP